MQSRDERPEGLDAILARATERNLYHRLGVKAGATVEEIDAAESAIVRQFHPDRWHNTPFRADCDRAVAVITDAASTLRDPTKYETYCRRNGIGLDRYPAPKGRSQSGSTPSLDGVNISVGLSTHVSSEDPHLFHDTKALMRSMDRAMHAGYLNFAQIFKDILPRGQEDPSLDPRCIRAARQTGPQEKIAALADHAVRTNSEYERISTLLSIFGCKPSLVETAIQISFTRDLKENRRDLVLLAKSLWIREHLPHLLEMPHIEGMSNVYPLKDGICTPSMAISATLSRALKPEALARKIYEIGIAQIERTRGTPLRKESWQRFMIQSVRMLPDPRSFFSSEKGKEILDYLLKETPFAKRITGVAPRLEEAEDGTITLVTPEADPFFLRVGGAFLKQILDRGSVQTREVPVEAAARMMVNLGLGAMRPLPLEYLNQADRNKLSDMLVELIFAEVAYSNSIDSKKIVEAIGVFEDRFLPQMVDRGLKRIQEFGAQDGRELSLFLARVSILCRSQKVRAEIKCRYGPMDRAEKKQIDINLASGEKEGLLE
jgi:curved DNA-binding protein CbpA